MIKLYKTFLGRDSISTPWGSLQGSIDCGVLNIETNNVDQAQFLIDRHGFKVSSQIVKQPPTPAPKKTKVTKSSAPKKSETTKKSTKKSTAKKGS